MKTFFIYSILLMLLNISCTSKEKDIHHESVVFEIVTDSIYSRMPGTLIKTKDYLVWQDPFNTNGFMHVVDIEKNIEIGVMGVIGQGPQEFNTPELCASSVENSVFVFDLNTSHQAHYSIDSLKENKNPYNKFENNEQHMITGMIRIDKNRFILSQPSEDKRFRIATNNNFIDFGSPFISNKIDNSYDINQGVIGFNERNRKFVFASLLLPYMEIYEIRNDTPTLIHHSDLKKNSYVIEGLTLKPKTQKKGARDLALLKDYIVTIQRDYDRDDRDESTVGMDFSKLPTTVFLYSYNGELQKIVDVGIPIFRISGDIQSNTIFAVGVNPEFVIIKCKL